LPHDDWPAGVEPVCQSDEPVADPSEPADAGSFDLCSSVKSGIFVPP
jgi:hypothetical protein